MDTIATASPGDTLIEVEMLATTIRDKLDELPARSSECCICRVPSRLRCLSENSYTPMMVSIGPLHHGKTELGAMEEHKTRYLQDFLQRTNTSLLECLQLVKQQETRLRSCYGQVIESDSESFVRMILVDACFIIELFLKISAEQRHDDEDDSIFSKPKTTHDICLDMFLLENQLPFFIIDGLFNLAKTTWPLANDHPGLSFTRLAYKFCQEIWDLEENTSSHGPISSGVKHLLHFLMIHIQPTELQHERKKVKTIPRIRTLTELRQAGAFVTLRSGKNLFDIKFNREFLKFPRLIMLNGMELVLWNLLAYEQYHCSTTYVNDYIIVMSQLIKTRSDEEILVDRGIAENWLGGDVAIGDAFQNLLEAASFSSDFFYYCDLSERLEMFCTRPFEKWKMVLTRDYFRDPWTAVCLVQSLLLLVLTVVQVFYAIKSDANSTAAKAH